MHGAPAWQGWLRANALLAVVLSLLLGVGAAWGVTASASSSSGAALDPSSKTAAIEECVARHWIRSTARHVLGPEQWSVVDAYAYANFPSAALSVHTMAVR